ncbi:DNA-methyltransferase [Staphylococcus equorum]|uniref:DNA-methyltransferase n=1 Tax=Staphylococcus equorum TaxID=246432 RepID=UPI002553BD25|nr:site-specific DNA-methyltransferase [Staphylococcus equorum]MDK9853146.1 site-specific DNA-methyltransferase [Staphylococcus equorum]
MELNKIYNEDCLEGMKKIPDKSVDMILCDLPYGTTRNKWDSVIPFELLWKQYERVIKDKGAIVLTSSGMFTAELMMSNSKMLKYRMIWEKSKATNFLNAKKQPLRKYEEICVFYKKQPTYNPQMSVGNPYNKGTRKNQLTGSYGVFLPSEVKSEGNRYPNDIVYFKTAESEGKVYHPTQKPVALFEYLIKTYSNEGETVLDNCMGSGTTAIACINTNRNYLGFELDEEYHNIANERINSQLFNEFMGV